ncbi:MAG TPA: hypothetical protein VGJ66_13070 [Pyrinomonadaceae bacterium]|jgi:hypothetical protein
MDSVGRFQSRSVIICNLNLYLPEEAVLYARGEFKPGWLTLDDIRANLEAAYHPGAEPGKQ